jgi:hypothetical protein
MFTSENNWYSWQYGDDPHFGRQTGNSRFSTHFKKCYEHIGSFKEELKKAAKSTIDYYPNLRPTIFFSGGVDSEIVLRTYKDIGVNPEVIIFRYEDDINILDVSYAIAICASLNIEYKLIDFNLNKFFENDAELISERAQIDFPRALPQLKFIDYADGLPIYCSSDPSWYRVDGENIGYDVKGDWISICYEHDIGYSKYIRYLDRPAIGEWFKWTPGLVISYTNLFWFKELINDKYYGKLGVNSTKILGYREVYPDLISRKKMTGFEPIDQKIEEFENFLEKKYKGLKYRNRVSRTLSELTRDITGYTTVDE